MFHRLETMVLSGFELPLHAVRSFICSALEIFIHVGFVKGRRKVLEISELLGLNDGEPQWNVLFVADVSTGNLMATGNRLSGRGKIERYG
jgi:pilus assembly protein CpaF